MTKDNMQKEIDKLRAKINVLESTTLDTKTRLKLTCFNESFSINEVQGEDNTIIIYFDTSISIKPQATNCFKIKIER